jgi:hypothetical protein
MKLFATAFLLSPPCWRLPKLSHPRPRWTLVLPWPPPLSFFARHSAPREVDEAINVASTVASSGNAMVVYTASAAGFAHSACTLINHNRGTTQPCVTVAGLVATTVASILQAAGVNSDSTGTATSRRDQGSTAAIFAGHMASNGFKWDTVDHVPVVAAYDATHNHTVVEHFVMRGLVNDAVTTVPHDHHVKTYADGTGMVITVASSSSSSSTNATVGAVQKRHDGAGFKYNWRRFDYQSNFLGSPDLSVIPNLAGAIAQDWAFRADNQNLDEYFLAGGIDQVYDFGLRIMSEIQGFGEEYEDVNICGDLGGRAHDELKVRRL